MFKLTQKNGGPLLNNYFLRNTATSENNRYYFYKNDPFPINHININMYLRYFYAEALTLQSGID